MQKQISKPLVHTLTLAEPMALPRGWGYIVHRLMKGRYQSHWKQSLQPLAKKSATVNAALMVRRKGDQRPLYDLTEMPHVIQVAIFQMVSTTSLQETSLFTIHITVLKAPH